MPTGFRVKLDDARNTTAPFPAHKADVEAITSAEADSVTGMPIGGSTTLILYAPDSSQLVYLSGYGIEHDGRLRFGAHCEETMPPPAPFSSQAGVNRGGGADLVNFTSSDVTDYLQHVAALQMLANTRLHTDPLPIDGNSGVFLVPSTHTLFSEKVTTSAGAIAG
ncbi:hypothetical protein Q4I28_000834 [Leishmania naiffi]|uniref:Uncharacterized protein n=1 Tax=Leishmania naiffi TaxID=5678 RepID=A0AAW3C7M9_9TRYP